MISAGEKCCFKCGETKPRAEFYRHPEMGDGLLGKCKSCAKKDVMEHRAKNLPTVKAYDRWRRRGRPRTRACQGGAARSKREFRANNPEKYRAHTLVNNAVRDGRLVRATQCETCGRPDRLHAHHEDYSRPFDVKWLCPPCHGRQHWLRDEVTP
jgi:hypothetical protein